MRKIARFILWWPGVPTVRCDCCYGRRRLRTGTGRTITCQECSEKFSLADRLGRDPEFMRLCKATYDDRDYPDSVGVLSDWLEERGEYALATAARRGMS